MAAQDLMKVQLGDYDDDDELLKICDEAFSKLPGTSALCVLKPADEGRNV